VTLFKTSVKYEPTVAAPPAGKSRPISRDYFILPLYFRSTVFFIDLMLCSQSLNCCFAP